MRAKLAKAIVKHVAAPMNRSYGYTGKNREFYQDLFYWREKYLLPIALTIDSKAATEQMVAECFWG